MTDELEIADWIKCMILDENRFHKFYSCETKRVDLYVFFISRDDESYMEKNKVELIDGILKWDKLSEIISSYKHYKGHEYSDPKIGVYNIDITSKQDVIEFIQGNDISTEMFKYWRFVKLANDIQFKNSIEMFGRLNSIYMFFNEYNS